MGVTGLETFISGKKDLLLTEFQLKNCYLVVDGNNVCCQLYFLTRSDSIFGGDYDEYYVLVKKFFQNLLKCKVIPIVIFDGGHERRKVKTVLGRLRSTMESLHLFNKGHCSNNLFPMFLKMVFFGVMRDLNIIFFQSELEADSEIAYVARALNCPVLSFDSDFYIYDVLYIPFSSLTMTPVRVNDSNFKGYFLPCFLYDIKNFLEYFSGLDKCMMPIAATLLGNDFNKNSAYSSFFLHVIIPNHGVSFTQRRIAGVFHWLKKETFNSAVQLITQHLGNSKSPKFLRALNVNISDYKNPKITHLGFAVVETFINEENSKKTNFEKKNEIENKLPLYTTVQNLVSKKNMRKNVKDMEMNVPLYFSEMIHKGKINTFVLDMINLKTYFTSNQVEDFKIKSCHFWSLKIIEAIYAIVKIFTVEQERPLSIYMINAKKYMRTFLESSGFLNNINLSEIISKSREERLNLIYEILAFNECDIKTVSEFSDPWSLFIISFIYWLKALDNNISIYHARALILCAICNQIVQKAVGYYRNLPVFTKDKGQLMKELESTELKHENKGERFLDFVESVPMYECLLMQQKLIPMRQTAKHATIKNGLNITAIHYFNAFQSCLFHIAQLNALLNDPLLDIKIPDFYSGTLIYNFYFELTVKKKGSDNFEEIFFKQAPHIFHIFEFLKNRLCGYCAMPNIGNCARKKRKKRKSPLVLGKDDHFTEENLRFVDDDDMEKSDDDISIKNYYDQNNRYSCLSKRKE